jgi:lipoyl(octanoyl) transferase
MREPFQVLVYPAKTAGGGFQYLLLHRTPLRGGFWQGVTGGVEKGETILAEETGFSPLIIEEAGYSYSLPMQDRWRALYAGGVQEISEHVFAALVADQQEPIIDPGEHDLWRWCGLSQALELLIWPENIEALKRCDELLHRIAG